MDFFWWCFAKEMDLISHSGFINGKINEYFHIYLKMLETAHTFHHTDGEYEAYPNGRGRIMVFWIYISVYREYLGKVCYFYVMIVCLPISSISL